MERLKVLVFFVGTRGDMMPGVGICKALEARGHEAVMAVCPGVEDSIRAYGVRCVVVGKIPFTWRDDTKVMSKEETVILRRSLNVSEFLAVANKHGVSWNLEDCLPDALPDCLDLLGKEHFDVLLCNTCTSQAAHRLLKSHPNLKVIRVTSSFFLQLTGDFPPGGYEMSGRLMNKLKHFHFFMCVFLPFVTRSDMFKREYEKIKKIQGIDDSVGMDFFQKIEKSPCLGLWSPALQERPADFPENLQVTGNVTLPQLDSWSPSKALEDFMKRKPLVISFGSMLGTQHLEDAVIKAAQKQGMSVLLCSDGKRQAEAVTSNFAFSGGGVGEAIREGLFKVDYVPFDWLLPKVSLVVCHGGAGTTFRAIGAGVPVVICPLITPIIADQMLHAQWVERKHFGSWIQPLEPSVEDCQQALVKALECRGTCESVAQRVQQEDGAKTAAEAIEELAKNWNAPPKASKPSGCFAGLGCGCFEVQ